MNTPSTSQQPSVRARLSLYVLVLVLVPVLAFFAGTAHFEATECSGPGFGGECDLAGLEGVLWAAGAIVLVLATVGITELVFARLRRQQRTHRDL